AGVPFAGVTFPGMAFADAAFLEIAFAGVPFAGVLFRGVLAGPAVRSAPSPLSLAGGVALPAADPSPGFAAPSTPVMACVRRFFGCSGLAPGFGASSFGSIVGFFSAPVGVFIGIRRRM